MKNEERKKLVVELYNRIKIAKLNSTVSNFYNTYKPTSRKGLGQTHFQIMEFYLFLKENPNLTDEEIREILNSNNKFSFLRKLDNLIPNLFEELKVHGVSYIKNAYITAKNGSKELRVSRI